MKNINNKNQKKLSDKLIAFCRNQKEKENQTN